MEAPFVRSPYNYDRDAASTESGLKCEDVSLTKQSFAEEADINVLVRRFGIGYEMPQGVRQPVFGDFVGISSYHEAVNAIAQANESFDALPAEVRSRFSNDPGAFVDFAIDPAHKADLKAWGLLDPAAVQPEAPAAPAAPAAPEGGSGA